MKKTIMTIALTLVLASLFASIDDTEIRGGFGASRNVALNNSEGYIADGPSVSVEAAFDTSMCHVVLTSSANLTPEIPLVDVALLLRQEAPVDEHLTLLLETGAGLRIVNGFDPAFSLVCRGGVRYSLLQNLELLAHADVMALSFDTVGIDATIGLTYRFV